MTQYDILSQRVKKNDISIGNDYKNMYCQVLQELIVMLGSTNVFNNSWQAGRGGYWIVLMMVANYIGVGFTFIFQM